MKDKRLDYGERRNVSYSVGRLRTRHLADIEQQAQNLFSQQVKDLAEKENATEELKAKDMMLWVQKMNNIRNRATEIANADIIYKV